MQVIVYDNDVNGAMRRLKKKMFNEGMIRDIMQRRRYEKPSITRRRRKLRAVREEKKRQAKKRVEYGL